MWVLTVTTAQGRIQVTFHMEEWAVAAANAMAESMDVEDTTIIDPDGNEVRYWEMTDAA